jgi:prevent-host-death family protein
MLSEEGRIVMVKKEITALALRQRFGEVMDEVRYRKEPYIVTRNGRPLIVLLDVGAYQALEEKRQEEAFIEEYADERVVEFLKEDQVDAWTARSARKLLGE